MSPKHNIIKFRRGTASEWQAANELLLLGEPGFEKDTHKLKIGDGQTLWNDLPYVADGMGNSGENYGPLKYTYDVDLYTLGGGGGITSYSSDLTSLPEWLSTYSEITGFTQDGSLPGNCFGFDGDGLWFTGDAQPSSESYPVRTNFDIPSEATCTVTYTVDYNDFCSDQGICFFKTGDSPQWSWGADLSRIAVQSNCPVPSIYGLNIEFEGNEVLSAPNYYTYEVVYAPSQNKITTRVYLGQNTNGTLLQTLVVDERLESGSDYRIGFAADQDEGDIKSYFTNLSISYNQPITKLAVNGISDSVDFSEFFQDLIDNGYTSKIKVTQLNNTENFAIYSASSPTIIEGYYVFDIIELVNNNLEYTNGIQYYFNIDITGSSSITMSVTSINLHNGGLQTAQVLQFNNPDLQSVITGPTPAENDNAQRLIIQGQKGQGTGEGGDVYFWGGDADTNGGDIKIYAGDADNGASGYGGYVNIDGGNGYNQGGSVTISAGNATLQAGDVSISAGYSEGTNGVVYIRPGNGTKQWIFNNDGALVFPNNSTVAVGTYDSGYSGNNGISLNCVVGYELNWQAGRLKNTYNNGEVTASIYFDSPITYAPTVVSLSFDTTIAVDAKAGEIFDITLTDNLLLDNPINAINGKTIRFRITQDNTGGRTITLGSKFTIPSSASSPLPWSTAGDKMDILAVTYHEGRDKWDVVAFVPGY